jgi:hypothetical protein
LANSRQVRPDQKEAYGPDRRGGVAMKYARFRFWLKKAQALGEDWERCDEETGRECRGVKCKVGAHRALSYLDRATDEADRAAKIHDLLLTAVKIGLQEHEPYDGYKITMLRQALQKATREENHATE